MVGRFANCHILQNSATKYYLIRIFIIDLNTKLFYKLCKNETNWIEFYPKASQPVSQPASPPANQPLS